MSSTYAEPLVAIERGLNDLAQIDPAYRTTSEKQDWMVRLARIESRAVAERMRVLVAADDIAEATGGPVHRALARRRHPRAPWCGPTAVRLGRCVG